MAEYLINQPFCYDDFIRSKMSEVRKAGEQSNSPKVGGVHGSTM